MFRVGSLECRLRWSLVLGCLSGVPLESTLWNQEGRNGIGQKERSSWITGWMTLADPMGHQEWRWPFRVVLTHPMAGLYSSTWKDYCMQPGSWRLPTGSTPSSWTTSPWREVWTSCLHVPPHPVSQLQGRWWRCPVGETLDDWCVSQNDDFVILLNTLWLKK